MRAGFLLHVAEGATFPPAPSLDGRPGPCGAWHKGAALWHPSFWGDRADDETAASPLPIASSVPSTCPPSGPVALGKAAQTHGALDAPSAVGSPEQDGWERSRAGSLGTPAKMHPGEGGTGAGLAVPCAAPVAGRSPSPSCWCCWAVAALQGCSRFAAPRRCLRLL